MRELFIHVQQVTMEDRQFYLWLPSNSSSDVFPRNTLAEYRVRLPNSIQPSGDWEVALTEIQYKKHWHNIRENFGNVFYVRAPKKKSLIDRVTIPPGHYHTLQEVIHQMNEAVKSEGYEKDVVFSISELSRKVTVQLNNRTELLFGQIGPQLGFSEGQNLSGTAMAKREADLNMDLHSLYVYTDIVEAQMVGDSKFQLIRIVPVETTATEIVMKTFLSPQYIPVSRKQFNTIEMNIRLHTGELVPFAAGHLLVTLHFPQTRPAYL